MCQKMFDIILDNFGKLINAYSAPQSNPASKMNHLQYRKQLIKTIIMYHLTGPRPADPGPGEPINAVYNSLRLIERNFPSRKNQVPGRIKSRCVRCNLMGVRKEVIYEYRPCNLALCITLCFEIYHTHKNIVNTEDSDCSARSELDDLFDQLV